MHIHLIVYQICCKLWFSYLLVHTYIQVCVSKYFTTLLRISTFHFLARFPRKISFDIHNIRTHTHIHTEAYVYIFRLLQTNQQICGFKNWGWKVKVCIKFSTISGSRKRNGTLARTLCWHYLQEEVTPRCTYIQNNKKCAYIRRKLCKFLCHIPCIYMHTYILSSPCKYSQFKLLHHLFVHMYRSAVHWRRKVIVIAL